jgi:hypothetical protein
LEPRCCAAGSTAWSCAPGLQRMSPPRGQFLDGSRQSVRSLSRFSEEVTPRLGQPCRPWLSAKGFRQRPALIAVCPGGHRKRSQVTNRMSGALAARTPFSLPHRDRAATYR